VSEIQELRVLTVRQPWAWAIIHGGKDVENRARNIAGAYRGAVAIHVALRDDDEWDERDAHAFIGVCPFQDAPTHNRFGCTWCREVAPLTWKQHGHIIGVVDLTDVHDVHACISNDDDYRTCSPWAEAEDLDSVHMVLANPRALVDPIPWKGALGLRKTNLFVTGDWIGEHVQPNHGMCTPYGCPPSCYSEPVAQLQAVTS
jgi:hypothetical protein